MNVGKHSFQEFKDIVARFHNYAAPGLLIGGYMVEMAKAAMPEGVLYEAVVETGKCLPDAVQLLTPLTIGNNWMHVLNLGRYALALYDKNTGAGFRVYLDPKKLDSWPEIKGWFLKLTPKPEQDIVKLLDEIERAGSNIASIQPIQIAKEFLQRKSMGDIGICNTCGEAYPTQDGKVCLPCQGQAPYEN